jgi:uncharacterized membrane protein YhaH (DUF805 family)
MNFPDAVKHCLTNYANFKGRAKRSEYWFFALFGALVYLVTMVLSYELYLIAVLGLLIPSLAAAVRRLHDRGRSGWNLLWTLIPIAGIVVLVWLVQDSTPGSNEYD